MKDILYIVMPAYNEEDNIEEVISEWHPICERIAKEGNCAKLVIANDGSRDSTYNKMLRLQSQYQHLLPLDKPNSGHGATVLHLYRKAIDDGANYIFQTDTDGQTRPDEFWDMWNTRTDFDLQIGTREGRQDGVSRIIVTKVLRLVVWLLFQVWVKDANTPFRLMKAERLQPILGAIPTDYNLANVAISAIAVKLKYSICWRPITFRPRQGGKNSINLRRIFSIGCKALTDFRTINKGLKR